MHQKGVTHNRNHSSKTLNTKTWRIRFCYCNYKRTKQEVYKKDNLQASFSTDLFDDYKKNNQSISNKGNIGVCFLLANPATSDSKRKQNQDEISN